MFEGGLVTFGVFDGLKRVAGSSIVEAQKILNNPKSSYKDKQRAMQIIIVLTSLVALLGCGFDYAIRGSESVVGQWFHAEPLLPE